MNTETIKLKHNELEDKIAQKYQEKGYQVWIQPQGILPFNLGGYQPDLIVKKSDDEGYIIEIKRDPAKQINIDRYREIAEIVSQHSGWRFLLITGEDELLKNQINNNQLLSWEQIVQKRKTSDYLISIGDTENGFLSLWIILEALLRKKAEEVFIPIERFPSKSLIKHIYSQGELSIEQYNTAINLLKVRNQLVHGFQISELYEFLSELRELVDELISFWLPEKIDIK